jgi:hypothetical protein
MSSGERRRRGKAARGHSKPTKEFPAICVIHHAFSPF